MMHFTCGHRTGAPTSGGAAPARQTPRAQTQPLPRLSPLRSASVPVSSQLFWGHAFLKLLQLQTQPGKSLEHFVCQPSPGPTPRPRPPSAPQPR